MQNPSGIQVTEALARIEKYEAQYGNEIGVYMPAKEHDYHSLVGDIHILAQEYRRELSDEPLSFDHLRAMGWEQVSKSSMRRRTGDGILWAVAGLTGAVHLRLDATYISHDATIGQLRTLERLLSPPSSDHAP